MKPCTFCFGDGVEFTGFTDGTTWNGFDNVWVSKQVHAQISAHFRAEYQVLGYHGAALVEAMQCFDEIEPDSDGLYSYARGFATSIVLPDRFSELGELTAEVSDKVWETFGTAMCEEYPGAQYGDLSPGATARLNVALAAAIAEWVEFNAPTNARCDNCHVSAAPDATGTTCRSCGRGVVECVS